MFIGRIASVLAVSLYLSSIVSILGEAVHSESSLLKVINVFIPFLARLSLRSCLISSI